MKGMSKYPNHYFDLAICDIPYGINVTNMPFLKERKNAVKQKNGSRLNPYKNKMQYGSNEWDLQPPSQDYFDELRRVSKNQIIFGVEYVNWKGLGNGRIKWNKLVPDGMSFKNYELAYCSMIDYEIEIDLLWSGMMQAKSLQEPTVPQGDKRLNEKRTHPCYKPRLLYRKLLSDYGFKGMKCLDTHLGGGSIRIEADLAGINLVAFEIDKNTFLKEQKRYNTFKSQLRLNI